MRILLIEDNELFGDVVKRYLQKEGYTVDWFQDASTVNAILQSNEHFDLVVTDLEIQEWSWKQWILAFKEKNPTVPVLMVTGNHSTTLGLNTGADIYLVKYQIDKESLLSSVRALLCRSARTKVSADSILKYKDISVDLNAREVRLNGELIPFARREFTLLHKLLANAGRVVPREELLQSLYGWENPIDSNALEVHVHNLRHKLNSKVIKTVRGIGYKVSKDTTAQTEH